MARYRLTARSFIDGSIKERGEVVTLPAFQRPGPHMMRVLDAPFVPAMPMIEAPVPAVGDVVIPITEQDPDRDFIAALTAPSSISRGPGYLILDTETNGFADPRAAAIALIFADADMQVEHEYSVLIRPDGWSMDPRATAINGLTDDRLEAEGVPILGSLHVWMLGLAMGRTLVAHNLDFDRRVMANEMSKAGLSEQPKRSICTMLKARAAGAGGSLDAAHRSLCGRPHDGAHDALADARACLAVLRVLDRKGAL